MNESKLKTQGRYKSNMSLHVKTNTDEPASSNSTNSITSASPLTHKKKLQSLGLSKTTKSSFTNCDGENCSPANKYKPVNIGINNEAECKTPPVTPISANFDFNDDLASEYSVATTSGRCTMSCEHPYVARNGTTFSGSKMKYMIHSSNHAGKVGTDYLTPTQRAQRQIKVLKDLLCVAREDLEKKDSEILKLTREVVELRLFKASLTSPDERSASSDAVTVCEAGLKTSQDVSPIINELGDSAKFSPHHLTHQHISNFEMNSSFADSGHFEDMSTSANDIISSIEDGNRTDVPKAATQTVQEYEVQKQNLISSYEQRIEELLRNHESENNELKRTHNEKIEALLQTLWECNTRYVGMVPDYELAKERIRELERHLDDLQKKLIEHEDKQKKMYLQSYHQHQESKKLEQADQALEMVYQTPNNVSIPELLKQLQRTQDELENIRASESRKECGNNLSLLTAKEAVSLWVLGARKIIYRRLLEAQKNHTHVDPDITLQFLKSAIYYFLTDKENSQGHLQAIESILEFTDVEKKNIRKALAI